MQKTIGFWNIEFPEKVSDVLLVKSDEIEIFQGEVEDGRINCPKKIVTLSPNGYAHYGFFLFYIKYLYYGTDDRYQVVGGGEDLSSFMAKWDSLWVSLEKFDDISAHKHLDFIEKFDHSLLKKKSVLVDLLRGYLKYVLSPSLNVQYYSGVSDSDEDLWWQKNPTLVNKVGYYCNYVNKYSDPFINKFIENIQKFQKFLLKTKSRTLTEKYYIFSYLCKSFASYYFKRSHFTESLICSQRSLDFYFQYLALDQGILRLRGNKLIYYKCGLDGEMVTLLNSVDALVALGFLASDKKRDDFIRWINRKRNKSILTHGVLTFTKTEAYKALSGVEKVVSTIDGNHFWKKKSENIHPTIKAEKSILFSMDSSLSTYIKCV